MTSLVNATIRCMFEGWFSEQCRWRWPMSRTIRDWLFWRRSMTIRMQQHAGTGISVKIISQSWQKPWRSEQRLLKLPRNQRCLIREVELYAADKMVMVARSVLPKGQLTERYRVLPKLKHRTIGQWFFRNRALQRSDFELQQLPVEHKLCQQAVATLSNTPKFLWARRSILSIPKQKLLLTEIFMPELFI